MDIVTMGVRAGIGALAGISYGLTGYGKSPGEKMDYEKLALTVILGAGVGAASEFLPYSMDEMSAYATTLGFTALIENGVKAAKRRIQAWLASRNK